MSRSFDGDNDVLTATAVVIDSTTTETMPFIVVAWVKRSYTSFGTEETLWINGAATTGNHLHCGIINIDNTVTMRARTTANSASTTVGTVADTTIWHMLAFKVTSTTSLGVSIDGAAFTNTTVTARDPTTATDTFRIGGTLAATPINEFSGLIAWVAVWRSALSDANLTSLWNGGSGVDPSTIGSPVAVWDLTGNESPEVNNITPGTYDLAVAGATFSSDNPFTVGGASGVPRFMNVFARRRSAA